MSSMRGIRAWPAHTIGHALPSLVEGLGHEGGRPTREGQPQHGWGGEDAGPATTSRHSGRGGATVGPPTGGKESCCLGQQAWGIPSPQQPQYISHSISSK
jgi:hypothetical protein